MYYNIQYMNFKIFKIKEYTIVAALLSIILGCSTISLSTWIVSGQWYPHEHEFMSLLFVLFSIIASRVTYEIIKTSIKQIYEK